MNRRRSANRKFKEKSQPEQEYVLTASPPQPDLEDKEPVQDIPDVCKQTRVEGGLPLAVVLEILAGEFEEGKQGDALCRAAVRLAEECGAMDVYRARWDAAQKDQAGHSSAHLFDRCQSLELLRYHQKKGNMEALKKETDKLRIIEGRLLFGQSSPLKITDEDLEKLEEFIRESGF